MGVAPLSVMKKVYTELGCSVMAVRVSTFCAVEVFDDVELTIGTAR